MKSHRKLHFWMTSFLKLHRFKAVQRAVFLKSFILLKSAQKQAIMINNNQSILVHQENFKENPAKHPNIHEQHRRQSVTIL